MRLRAKHRKYSLQQTVPIFGVSLNPVTGTWFAFNEVTLTDLSEHKTEAQAHAACRRYEAAAFRRLIASTPLADLAHRAI
jgi:hypothetical protein